MSTELRTLIQRLDDESRAAMERAAELCAQQTHFSVDPEHLLIELLRDKDSSLQRLNLNAATDARPYCPSICRVYSKTLG